MRHVFILRPRERFSIDSSSSLFNLQPSIWEITESPTITAFLSFAVCLHSLPPDVEDLKRLRGFHFGCYMQTMGNFHIVLFSFCSFCHDVDLQLI